MASDFVKRKAAERAKIIDEKFGKDAYGGSGWREQTTKENKVKASDKTSGSNPIRRTITEAASGYLTGTNTGRLLSGTK